MADKSDKDELIRAAIMAGDPGAFDLIWDEYGKMLFGMMLSMLCSHHDAEEVLQDVFVKIARNKESIAEAKKLGGYLYSMARNEAFSFRKRASKVPQPTDPADFWLLPAKVEANFGDEVVQIATALEQLPEEQRTVIVMKVYKDMTFQEISDVLAVSLNTAASRYRYGMEKLRVHFNSAKNWDSSVEE